MLRGLRCTRIRVLSAASCCATCGVRSWLPSSMMMISYCGNRGAMALTTALTVGPRFPSSFMAVIITLIDRPSGAVPDGSRSAISVIATVMCPFSLIWSSAEAQVLLASTKPWTELSTRRDGRRVERRERQQILHLPQRVARDRRERSHARHDRFQLGAHHGRSATIAVAFVCLNRGPHRDAGFIEGPVLEWIACR